MPPRKTTNTSRNRTYYYNNTHYTKTTRPTASTTWYSCNSPKYNPARTECQWRMGSYRNLYSQFTGTGAKTYFSPASAKRWVNYVSNGMRVYKFNNNEFQRYFGATTTRTLSACRQYLRHKFGTGIKDVMRGRGNCWLVATTKNVTGRPFNNYCWT